MMTDDDEDATPIEMVALELSEKADWRRVKARQYPDDERNLDAAELLDRLAGEVLALDGSAAGEAFEDAYEAAFSGGDAREVLRRWSEYRSEVGFKRFPDSGEDVLADMTGLARDGAG
jgi:hypothetical protein